MSFLAGLAVGVLIGWHVPQPTWAKTAIEAVKTKLKL